MEYIKGEPYFCFCEQKIKQYSYLKNDLTCDILIIGGGIDGAIANFYLSKKYDVALVDKSRLGYACTSCATALLEYQLDDFAKDLKEYLTNEQIVLAYKMAIKAMDKINAFISEYGNYCHFSIQPTLLFTESKKFVEDVKQEYEFRKSNGFDCELITPQQNPFPFKIMAGIFAQKGGASFNPYLFCKQMIENSKNQEKIFENTHITKLEKTENGYTAITNFGERIFCKKVIIATGFNWELLNKSDLCDRFISYSIVTSPVNDFSWHKNALIHDVKSPYHYLRLLPDSRIIFGGEDIPFKEKPINAKKAKKKYDKLAQDLFKLFPNLKEKVKIEYKFAGCFGTTKNNLGLIGESPQDANLLYFISCGANGIINAIAGVDVIDDLIQHRPNKLIEIFSPKRQSI